MNLRRFAGLNRILLINWIVVPVLGFNVLRAVGFGWLVGFVIAWLIADKVWDGITGVMMGAVDTSTSLDLNQEVPSVMVAFGLLDIVGTLAVPWVVAHVIVVGLGATPTPVPVDPRFAQDPFATSEPGTPPDPPPDGQVINSFREKATWLRYYAELNALIDQGGGKLQASYRTGPSGQGLVHLELKRGPGDGLTLIVDAPPQSINSLDPVTGELIVDETERHVTMFRDTDLDGWPDSFASPSRGDPLYPQDTLDAEGFMRVRDSVDHSGMFMIWTISLGYSTQHFLGQSYSAISDLAAECFDAGQRKDYMAAAVYCTQAADRGDAEAQHNLAWMYSNGVGVPENEAKAIELLTKSAEQGFAKSQTILGVMYSSGEGVPEDDAKAAEWYIKAAEQGEDWAQGKLAWAYLLGKGVPQNNKRAYVWFNLALENSTDPADQERLGRWRDDLEAKMTAEDISEAQRLSTEWFEKFKARQDGD